MRLTIDRLSLHADGVATGPEGRVHVAMALPGEEVEGEIAGGRIEAPRIVTPSAARVRPPCAHYRACGGCALQHASDDFVAGWKADVVRVALAGQGLEAPVAAVETSPPRSRRRATLAGRRTKKGTLVGFHARASGTVIEIADCLILRPELMAALPALHAATALGASRKGEVAFTLTLSEAGLDVAAQGGKKPDDPALFEALAGLARSHDLARLSWNGETVAARRPAAQQFGRAHVVPPAGAFLQATADGEAALLAGVRAAIGAPARVADLFAGAGTFALALAETAEVHAVEGEAAMVAAMDQAWRATSGLKHLGTEARDLFRRPLLPDELAGYDAIVIDPPRAGAEAQVAQIARSQVPLLAYVSCNPVTFARDARVLAGASYVLDWVRVVDQFRWSAHVELVARFRLPHIPR
ncbi:MAG: class I SAM-dependent RNA methyltransferase [Paracoccaceae bacterium]